MKSIALALSGILSLSGLAECHSTNSDVHAVICVSTVQPDNLDVYPRLSDVDCETGQNKARWRYYPDNIVIPRVGGDAAGKTGSWTKPEGTLVHMPADRTSSAREERNR